MSMISTIAPPTCTHNDGSQYGRRQRGARVAGILLSLLAHLLGAIVLFGSFAHENSMPTPQAPETGRRPIVVTLLPVAKSHAPARISVPQTPVAKVSNKPSFKAVRPKTAAMPVKGGVDTPRLQPRPTNGNVVQKPVTASGSHVRPPSSEARSLPRAAPAPLTGTSKTVSPKAAAISDVAKPLKPLPVDYLMEVSRLIDVNLYYPWQAKRDHDQGSAIVHILLARDGTVLAVHLIQGTDYPSLDQEACQVVLRVHKFPGLPADVLAGVDQFAIDQPVRFHLY